MVDDNCQTDRFNNHLKVNNLNPVMINSSELGNAYVVANVNVCKEVDKADYIKHTIGAVSDGTSGNDTVIDSGHVNNLESVEHTRVSCHESYSDNMINACSNFTNTSNMSESVGLNNLNNLNRLKIMVWNIHGLGDKLKDIDFLHYISNYDLIIFLETMKLDTYSPGVSGYVYKHFQRKFQHRRSRKPAGGIGVLFKSNLQLNGTIKVIKNSDFTVWIRIKQDNTDLYLAGVYIPPLDSSSTISSFQNNNAFSLIQEEISHFSQKGNIAICGDFNARTGKLADFSSTTGKNAIDMISFDSGDSLPMYHRYSDDVKTNKYGKELIELCKSSNLRIMNGYFKNNESTGTFTCYTPRGKSLIDYLICDASFYHNILDFNLDPLCVNSDHRPLVFSVKVGGHSGNNSMTHQCQQAKKGIKYCKYVYKDDALVGLFESLNSVRGLALHDTFIDTILNDGGVNEAVNSVYIYTLLENTISDNCT